MSVEITTLYHGLPEDPGPEGEIVTETADAVEGPDTEYSIQVGDSFLGTIAAPGDRDWVAVTLVEGTTYDLAMTAGTLSDGYLRLYDGAGKLLAEDDDSGDGLDPVIREFTVGSGGTYYLEAASYADIFTGSYTLHLQESPPPRVLDVWTVDEVAEQLAHGYWEDTGRSHRSFDLSDGESITANITGLAADGRALAKKALSAWTWSTGLEFEITSGDADITFDDEQVGAYTVMSTVGETILESEVNISKNWLRTYGTSVDSYSFQTYIHEIGHALGLGHAGPYNGSAIWGVDNSYLNDSWQMTVMSYFSQNENDWLDASFAFIVTPMIADIAAIDMLYDLPGEIRTGKTVYGENSNLDGYAARLSGMESALAYTIIDDGGRDKLDGSREEADQRIDLREGAASDMWGITGNVLIALGTVIEIAVGGDGDDWIIGNAVDNRLVGKDGDDHIQGLDGADHLRGRAGKDLLEGGRQADLLEGDGGTDDLRGNGGADNLFGGAGQDLLNGGWGPDQIFGGTVNELAMLGEAGEALINSKWDDDLMIGGEGADVFIFKADSGTDTIVDFEDGLDVIRILTGADGFADLDIADVAEGALVTFAETAVKLLDIASAKLTADDFLFV
ncbi:M10 family metallopeptidase [Halovulum sp. GXIMD14794]